MTFLLTWFPIICKRHQLQTLHANSMWSEVNSHLFFFLISSTLPKNMNFFFDKHEFAWATNDLTWSFNFAFEKQCDARTMYICKFLFNFWYFSKNTLIQLLHAQVFWCTASLQPCSCVDDPLWPTCWWPPVTYLYNAKTHFNVVCCTVQHRASKVGYST